MTLAAPPTLLDRCKECSEEYDAFKDYVRARGDPRRINLPMMARKHGITLHQIKRYRRTNKQS